ncbi:MAG TPA: hypothetical protein VLL69_17130, partial [Streptosporangiaceae bacterium]|nr:hypothetical protein [Streptosporangiaceae bacterium]
LIFWGLEGCGDTASTPAPLTITLLDPGWLDKEFVSWRKHEEEEFTRETGILVKDLPAPETAIDQLTLWHKLLQNSTDAPDVFAIDVIWPALMADYSLPLTPYLSDTRQDFPVLVANDTVEGQLVAMPYHADAGLLWPPPAGGSRSSCSHRPPAGHSSAAPPTTTSCSSRSATTGSAGSPATGAAGSAGRPARPGAGSAPVRPPVRSAAGPAARSAAGPASPACSPPSGAVRSAG